MLTKMYREVFESDEYKRQVVMAMTKRASDARATKLAGEFTLEILNFLRLHADTCQVAYRGDDGGEVYIYKPDPPGGYGVVSVLFIEEEDEKGSYLWLEEYYEDA